jgi:predicted secreted protein
MRRLAVAVALVLLGTGCSVTRVGDAHPSAGDTRSGEEEPAREFTIEDTSIRVGPGESFTIAVDDNASVGDLWSVSAEPDASVVESVGDDYVADSDEPVAGGGGTRYFRFTATRSGTTTVELRNCYRGCHDPGDDHRYELAIEVG